MPVSRPGKLSHSQTLLYEIDMLRHTAQKLAKDQWQDEMDQWVCLEAFLVHFRNLVEFFGHPAPRGDDLNINKPEAFWPDFATRPPDVTLRQLYRPDLWTKYEDARNDRRISRYLHHCTEQRIDPRDWRVGDMHDEIEAVLSKFEQLLLDKSRTWTVPVLQAGLILGAGSSSTATVTSLVGSVSQEDRPRDRKA